MECVCLWLSFVVLVYTGFLHVMEDNERSMCSCECVFMLSVQV